MHEQDGGVCYHEHAYRMWAKQRAVLPFDPTAARFWACGGGGVVVGGEPR